MRVRRTMKSLIIQKDKSGLAQKDMYLMFTAEIIPHTKSLIKGDSFVKLIPHIKDYLDNHKSREDLEKENQKLKYEIKQLKEE